MTTVYANAVGVRGVYSERPQPEEKINTMLTVPEVEVAIPVVSNENEHPVRLWTDGAKREHAMFREIMRDYVITGRRRTAAESGERAFIDLVSDLLL